MAAASERRPNGHILNFSDRWRADTAFFSPALLAHRLCLAIIGAVALQSLSFVHGVFPASAQASQAASEPNRPAYQIGSAGRFDED